MESTVEITITTETFVKSTYDYDKNTESMVVNPVEADSNLVYSEDNIIRGIYFAIGSLGIIANGFVLFVFLATKLRRFDQSTNIYLFNQSVLDMLAAIFLVLLTAFESRDPGLLSGPGGDFYCRVWLSKLPLWSVLVSSTFNLVVINIERYIAILHPVWHKNNFNNNTVKGTLVFIWIIGFAYNSAYLLPTCYVEDGNCLFLAGWSPLTQQLVGVLTAIVQFFLPVFVHGFCCVRIVTFLNQRVNKIEDQPPQNGGTETVSDRNAKKKEAALHIRNQVLKTLTLMTICFFLCWVWNQVLFFLASVGVQVSFQGVFYHFTVVAVYVNCLTSPFVYVAKYKSFRESAIQLIFRRQPNSVGDVTVT